MKFFITNKKINAHQFGNWYYYADKKCKVLQHKDTIYIYFGYLIKGNLEEKITQDFDGLISANGSFTCAKISSDGVEVIVDYLYRIDVIYELISGMHWIHTSHTQHDDSMLAMYAA